ncbi:MAG: hypothetical protein V7K97_29110 [Nostoc sp.]
MALRKDTALALTGSQPRARAAASSSLTRGSSPFKIHSQPGGWERDDTSLWAFLSAIRYGTISDR